MGIHDRDYYRESTGSFFDGWGRQTTTVWLVAITCIVFLAQVLSQDVTGIPGQVKSPVTDFGVYNPVLILEGQVWRLVTPLFLHAGLWHLAINMFVLFWAGSKIEELYGHREFLLYYLTAGIFANCINLLFYAVGIAGPVSALGASGAVMAVLVLYACHDPYREIYVFMVIPAPLWVVVLIYAGIDLFGAMGIGARGIGYVVHLGGALFGFLYYKSGWRISRFIPGSIARSRQRTGPTLRVVSAETDDLSDDEPGEPVAAGVDVAGRSSERSDEPLEARVDRVLEKVSLHGQESLTAQEREILFRASELYKKRRK